MKQCSDLGQGDLKKVLIATTGLVKLKFEPGIMQQYSLAPRRDLNGLTTSSRVFFNTNQELQCADCNRVRTPKVGPLKCAEAGYSSTP